jgi:hypothetical protein
MPLYLEVAKRTRVSMRSDLALARRAQVQLTILTLNRALRARLCGIRVH